jgi:hypothetical protein
MDAWLTETVEALAESAGMDAATLTLSGDDADALLKIARIASHDSGDRTNAPLLCYLIGRLLERSPTAGVAQLHAVVASRAQQED